MRMREWMKWIHKLIRDRQLLTKWSEMHPLITNISMEAPFRYGINPHTQMISDQGNPSASVFLVNFLRGWPCFETTFVHRHILSHAYCSSFFHFYPSWLHWGEIGEWSLISSLTESPCISLSIRVVPTAREDTTTACTCNASISFFLQQHISIFPSFYPRMTFSSPSNPLL